MGRVSYLDSNIGIRVSIRADPGVDEAEIILLSDNSTKAEIGEVPSVVRYWKAHEALQAAALLVMAEDDFHLRPRVRRTKNNRSLGLRIEIKPNGSDTVMHVLLRDGSGQIASRDLSDYDVGLLITALQRAANDMRQLRETFGPDDD
jgi:hypothetical protein